jgi:hypothetical protein
MPLLEYMGTEYEVEGLTIPRLYVTYRTVLSAPRPAAAQMPVPSPLTWRPTLYSTLKNFPKLTSVRNAFKGMRVTESAYVYRAGLLTPCCAPLLTSAPCPLPRPCSEFVSLGITTAGITPDAEYPFEGASFASLYVAAAHT